MRFVTGSVMIPGLVASLCLGLAACATPPAPPPGSGGGRFVIERDLLGTSTARGEFRAITGVRRPFTARLKGALVGDVFTLEEAFAYDDGERDTKTWVLERLGEGRYRGRREDVVGFATGVQDGDVFRLEYDVILPAKAARPAPGAGPDAPAPPKRGRKVHFRDVLARGPGGQTLNRANVSLWGFKVGSVALTIYPDAPPA